MESHKDVVALKSEENKQPQASTSYLWWMMQGGYALTANAVSGTGALVSGTLSGTGNLISGTANLAANVVSAPLSLASNVYEYFNPSELTLLCAKLAELNVAEKLIDCFFVNPKSSLPLNLQKVIFDSIETKGDQIKVLLGKLYGLSIDSSETRIDSLETRISSFNTIYSIDLNNWEPQISDENKIALTSEAALVLCELGYLTINQMMALAPSAAIICTQYGIAALTQDLLSFEELNIFSKNKQLELILSADGISVLEQLKDEVPRFEIMEELSKLLKTHTIVELKSKISNEEFKDDFLISVESAKGNKEKKHKLNAQLNIIRQQVNSELRANYLQSTVDIKQKEKIKNDLEAKIEVLKRDPYYPRVFEKDIKHEYAKLIIEIDQFQLDAREEKSSVKLFDKPKDEAIKAVKKVGKTVNGVFDRVNGVLDAAEGALDIAADNIERKVDNLERKVISGLNKVFK